MAIKHYYLLDGNNHIVHWKKDCGHQLAEGYLDGYILYEENDSTEQPFPTANENGILLYDGDEEGNVTERTAQDIEADELIKQNAVIAEKRRVRYMRETDPMYLDALRDSPSNPDFTDANAAYNQIKADLPYEE